MMSHLPAGKVHDNFTAWAGHNGITIKKLKVAAIPNAGIGIVATENIKAGEIIVFTPSHALLTREVAVASAPPLPQRTHKNGIERGVHELRTHALIAIVLATDSYREQKPWQDVWPEYESFKEFMPLLWPSERQQLLTPSALAHVNRQREKFEADFKKVKNLGYEVTRDAYIYAWVLVNTRTLFYESNSAPDVSREDRMCMCPFIDYFNHSDEGCEVKLSPKGFVVTSNREYTAGEQVYVSYGPHNNDFLLCEYGFILDTNKYDDVNVDNLILPLLTHQQKDYLDGRGFLANYNFDRHEFCFRTKVALRMSFINLRSGNVTDKLKRWQMYIDGADDGARDEYAVRQAEWDKLAEMRMKGEEVLRELDDLGGSGGGPRVMDEMIRRRWGQVLEIIGELERSYGEES